MRIKRRFVLKSLGFGAGLWALSPAVVDRRLKADPKKPERFFIFCYFGGGWDTLISLDPKDENASGVDKIDQQRINPGYDRLPAPYDKGIIQPEGSNINWGPVMGGFARHSDVSCVVRGVAMDTVSHTVGRRYFVTGMMPRGQTAVGSSLPTWIIAEQGARTPIPNLVVGVESYNRGLPAYASGLRVSGVGDLRTTLTDGPDAPDKILREAIEEYRAQNSFCDPAALDHDGLFSLIRTSQTQARVLVSRGLDKYFNFNLNTPEMRDLNTRYNLRRGGSTAAQAAMAYQALKNGVAQTVSIQITGGLDTHGNDWATNQSARLGNAYTALGTLVDDLKTTPHPTAEGKKLIDSTTIICFSEFARTPRINGNGGRDHWLASSCLLVGAGVPHNKVIGATTNEGFDPASINPTTGEKAVKSTSNPQIVTPTRIYASVMKNAGYQYDQFRVDGFDCFKPNT